MIEKTRDPVATLAAGSLFELPGRPGQARDPSLPGDPGVLAVCDPCRINMWNSRWTERAVAWAVGGMFVYAGGAKLADLSAFEAAIADYGIVYDRLLPLTAGGLVAAELAGGVGLIVDRRWSLPTIAALVVLFLAVLSYGLWLGLDIECGCFGVGDDPGSGWTLWQAVGLDTALLGACGYLAVARGRRHDARRANRANKGDKT